MAKKARVKPPRTGDRPRGKAAATAEQNGQYKKMIEEMRKAVGKESGFQLRYHYAQGAYAARILANPDKFGVRKEADLAADLGVKSLTIKLSMRFAKLMPKEKVETLSNLPSPPAWRRIMNWLHIKDDAKREEFLSAIVSGKPSGDLDDMYRKLTGKGSRRSRRPATPAATLKQIGGSAQTAIEHIGWLDKALKAATEADQIGEIKSAIKAVAADLDKLVQTAQAAAEVLKAVA